MEDKSINVGKVAITMGGNYDPSKAYDKLVCVNYNYRSWVSKKPVSEGIVPSEANSAFWQMISDRGERGPQGQSYVDKELVPIVDDLTTGGSANVLSAEQGKVLKQELTELESEIVVKKDELNFVYKTDSYIKLSTSLVVGEKYRFVVTAKVDCEIESIKIGTDESNLQMKLTLVESLSLKEGETWEKDIDVNDEGIQFIRIPNNSQNVTCNVYLLGGIDYLATTIQQESIERDIADKKLQYLARSAKGGVEKINYNLAVSQDSYIVINDATLVKGETYRISFTASKNISISEINLNTADNTNARVQLIDKDVILQEGEKYYSDFFVVGYDNVRYIRIFENAFNISDFAIYRYVGEDANRISHLENRDSKVGDIISLEYITTKVDENYYMAEKPLVVGRFYDLKITTNNFIEIESIKVGTDVTSASMKYTLAENVFINKGAEYTSLIFKVEDEGIRYIRILNNSNISSISIREYQPILPMIVSSETKVADAVDTNIYLNNKINQNVRELRYLKNCVDESVSSLIQVHGQGIEKQIPVSTSAHTGKFVRLSLHYGSERYTPTQEDVFFDGACRKDFSDIRFFDDKGRMLKAMFGPSVNMDILPDNNVGRPTPNGKLIGRKNGMLAYSVDNGVTYNAITGTANVTSNASDVYGYTSMMCVYVDNNDNIYAYAGGKLYKLLSADNYVTKKEVLDFSWVNSNGDRVYPEIQNHGIDGDNNGNLVLGIYQGTKYFHVDVYTSNDDGETWSKTYEKHDSTGYQHVHHVHYDKYNDAYYIGVDSVMDEYGTKILKSTNHGVSWIDITSQIEPNTYMKDYYPTYFGTDYRLGGGETYIKGRATIYRSDDDIHLKSVVKGVAGVRSFADFGDDHVIVCGTSQCNNVAENHILVSMDKGKTWESLYTQYQDAQEASGMGFRDCYNAVLLNGDTESCIIMLKDNGNVPSMRIYHGGDNYYRECFVMLEDENTSHIVAKTGYMMAYPYKTLQHNNEDNLVYRIPLDECIGKHIHDSRGKIAEIVGEDYTWERISDDVVRYGDYLGRSTKNPLYPSSAICLKKGTYIDFGKIKNLSFSNSYTISFWIKGGFNYPSRFNPLFSIGNATFFQRSIGFGIVNRYATIVDNDVSAHPHSYNNNTALYRSTEDYYHVAIVVNSNNIVKVFVNGCNIGSESTSTNIGEWLNLNTDNFIIGSDKYLNDYYIADIRIYNRVFDNNDVLRLYRGCL